MSALLLLKVSVLLSSTLAAAWLMRRSPAASRHRLWSVAFAAMLLLPALAASLPALHVPVPAGWEPAASTRADASSQSRTITTSETTQAPSLSSSTIVGVPTQAVRVGSRPAEGWNWPGLSSLLFAIWMTGVIGAAATVLHSLWRVRRLVRTSDEVTDDSWKDSAATLGTQLGVRHPVRLLSTSAISTPMAGGVWRPAIFLPRSAGAWSPEHRDLVLAHELAHLAGQDPLRHLMTRLALACYWFHPLAWLAAREAAIAREQACDETVLSLGARPSAYARLLLDLAESASSQPPARLLGVLPMVHRSHLEKRLMAILNVDVRPAARRFVAGPLIGVSLLTLSVAAATPLEQSQGGTVVGVPSGVVAGVPAGVVAGVPSGVVVGAPIGIVAGVPAGVVVGSPSGVVAGVPTAPFKDDAVSLVIDDQNSRDSACWSDDRYRGNFIGSMNTRTVRGRTVVSDQVGWRGGDRIIQRTICDLQLCMIAEGLGDRSDSDRPSQWIGRASRVVMESRRGSSVQRLELSGARQTWQVGDRDRDFDSAAQTWRDRMLAVLDTTWELTTLHGEESSLRGQISAIQGQRSALQGQISSLQGQVSSMQGRISSAQGEESSLRGQISAIQGHVSSLQGAISAQQGAISSLTSSRYGGDATERRRIAAKIADHDAEIARIQRQIDDYDAGRRIAAVERQIADFNARRRTNAIEAEIRDFNLDRKVEAIERQIRDLNVDGKVADIERQIRALDVSRRARQLEERLDADLPRLETAISAVR